MKMPQIHFLTFGRHRERTSSMPLAQKRVSLAVRWHLNTGITNLETHEAKRPYILQGMRYEGFSKIPQRKKEQLKFSELYFGKEI